MKQKQADFEKWCRDAGHRARWLDTRATALLLGISPKKLLDMRMRRCRLGKSFVYDPAEIAELVEVMAATR